MFRKNIFRDKAMKRLSTPDEFDDPVKLISIKAWILFLLLFAASSAVIVWLFFSRVNRELNCTGLIIKENKIAETRALSAGLIERIFVKRGDEVKKGETLISIMPAAGEKNISITAPAGGRIFEVNIQEGNFVNVGDKLVSIEKADSAGKVDDFEVTAFISVKNIHTVKINAPVFIAPMNVDVKEYGYLMGKVTGIANYPVSQERKNLLAKENPQLASLLREEIYEAAITPLRENGKLKWSSAKGAGINSVSGTSCDIKIIIDEKNISGFVFK